MFGRSSAMSNPLVIRSCFAKRSFRDFAMSVAIKHKAIFHPFAHLGRIIQRPGEMTGRALPPEVCRKA